MILYDFFVVSLHINLQYHNLWQFVVHKMGEILLYVVLYQTYSKTIQKIKIACRYEMTSQPHDKVHAPRERRATSE